VPHCPTLLQTHWYDGYCEPVHSSLHSSIFHYCYLPHHSFHRSAIRNDKMQPFFTDTFYAPLPLTAISHFNVETIFLVNVLSVVSSNDTDESHTYRMLTVSRHCAGHNCPSGLWKLKFPAESHNWTFGVSVSYSVFHTVIACYSLFTNDGPNSFLTFHRSYCPLYWLLVSDCISHLSLRVVMLHEPFGATLNNTQCHKFLWH